MSNDYEVLMTWLNSKIKTGPYAHMTYKEKFLSFIDKTDACWIWTGPEGWAGYGVFRKQGRTEFAHRVSYVIFNQQHPGKLNVCHTCDNPLCVNPRHLFVGTDKDNSDDKFKKGRANIPKGEKSGKAKLSRSDVINIRRRFKKDGKTPVALAREYGVNKENIYRIAYNHSWQWLKEE